MNKIRAVQLHTENNRNIGLKEPQGLSSLTFYDVQENLLNSL